MPERPKWRPMLPFTLQFLIAMIASAISERLQRKLDYSLEEVRVLKEILHAATGRERIPFTADQRRRLALAGIKLSPEERRKCCQIIKPGTILSWFRRLAARKYDSSESKVGRPRKRKDIRKPGGRDGAGELGLGLHENPRRSSDGIEDRDRTNDGGQHPAGGRDRAGTGAREEAHVEAVHEEPLGHAMRLRFLQRGSLGRIRHGSVHGVLRHRTQEPRRRDCRDSRRPRRSVDEAGGAQFDRSCGWISAKSKVPDPRSGPAVLEGIHRRSQSRGREERENPSAEPQLQSVRRALREDHQVRVSQSIRHLRRATFAPPDQGIRRALHDRAFSPRHWWPTHQERRSDE